MLFPCIAWRASRRAEDPAGYIRKEELEEF